MLSGHLHQTMVLGLGGKRDDINLPPVQRVYEINHLVSFRFIGINIRGYLINICSP